MKVLSAIVLCLAVVAAQPVDNDRLAKLPDMRGFSGASSAPITGRVEAPAHSVPSQVGIWITLPYQGVTFCGGSLLSPEWVLTSARCVPGGTNFEVILGAHDLRTSNETSQVRVNTTEAFVYPQWNAGSYTGDVALLHLPEPVTLTPAIQPVRLPSQRQANNEFVGQETRFTYWGLKNDTGPTTIGPYLQSINKTVIDYDTCSNYYSYLSTYISEDDHICTFDDTDAMASCNGDYGDPLIIREADGKDTQIGLFTFGIIYGCGAAPPLSSPSVFARLTTYLDWIAQQAGLELRP